MRIDTLLHCHHVATLDFNGCATILAEWRGCGRRSDPKVSCRQFERRSSNRRLVTVEENRFVLGGVESPIG